MPIPVNPATGEKLPSLPAHSPAEALTAVERAQKAFLSWRETSFREREELLRRIAGVLREQAVPLSALITQEMGKLPAEAQAEVKKCADTCEFLSHHGARWLEEMQVGHPEFRASFVAFRPLGVLLAIMPWNFPFWQVIRAAAPAMMCGNAVVLKHASNTPGCAQALEKLFREAGAPPGLFTSLLISAEEVEPLIAHKHIRGVTLTGSTPAGREVAALAGKHLKKTVLELGGSDAYVILEDADIAKAAKVLAAGRLLNCGQSCISAKRLVVVEKVREAFTRALLAECANYVSGKTLAPLARADLREELHRQVTQSVERGAELLAGGKIPSGPGFYYPATLLARVKPGMPAYEEELFGPVLTVIPARNEEEALCIANDSDYGLGGGIFTQDVEHGIRLARERLDAGSCFVNAFVRSDPRFPFGGVKDSGYGRELSLFGLREFVNIKAVAVGG